MGNVIRKRQPFATRLRGEFSTQAFEQRAQAKGLQLGREATGLQLGQGQNAIDHAHHLPRRAFGGLGVEFEFCAHVQGFDQLQRADYPVHGRAQFVGDRRQELVFKLVGAGQLLVHCRQFLPGFLQGARMQVTHGVDPVGQRQRQQAAFDRRADLAGVHGQEDVRQVAQDHQRVDQTSEQKGRPGNYKIARHPQTTGPGHHARNKDDHDKRQRQRRGQPQGHGITGDQRQQHDQRTDAHQQDQRTVQPAALRADLQKGARKLAAKERSRTDQKRH